MATFRQNGVGSCSFRGSGLVASKAPLHVLQPVLTTWSSSGREDSTTITSSAPASFGASSSGLGGPEGSSGLLRSGHSNGHHLKASQRQYVWGSKGQLHSGMAYGSGGTGSAGGLSFRSGGGAISFRGARHQQLDASVLRLHATGASGSSTFRATGRATFRALPLPPASAATPSPPAPASSPSGTANGSGVAAAAPAQAVGAASGSARFRRVGVASFRGAAGGAGEVGLEPSAQPSGSRGAPATSPVEQLKELGLAGVVAYGLLNTVYYTFAFLTVWLAVAKVPHGQGLAAAAKSFLAVFATVWAGSQVTKVARAAGALVLAPIVERGLGWVQRAFKLQSKNQAFAWILGGCLAVALTVFGVVVVAWA